jgi:hypothetical protein
MSRIPTICTKWQQVGTRFMSDPLQPLMRPIDNNVPVDFQIQFWNNPVFQVRRAIFSGPLLIIREVTSTYSEIRGSLILRQIAESQPITSCCIGRKPIRTVFVDKLRATVKNYGTEKCRARSATQRLRFWLLEGWSRLYVGVLPMVGNVSPIVTA